MAGHAPTGVPRATPTAVSVRHPPMLDAIVADALDPAYADAAARHADRPPRARSATVALLVVGGLVVGLTVTQERTAAPAAEQTRTALLGDARQRTAAVDALSAQVEQLRRENSRLQGQVLDTSEQGRALAQQRTELSAAAGQTAVSGPGLAVTVDDADPTAVGRGSSEARPDVSTRSGRVTDRDLQDVVNALWASGAEAIAVGGIRLSPTTAIRTAGETVLADYRPLVAPYVVLAVGDSATIERLFRLAALDVLTRFGQQGNPVRLTRRADLQLPAASGVENRSAVPLGTSGTGSGSPRPTTTANPSTRTSGAPS